MMRRYDMIHAFILLAFLVIANFVGNAVVKGIVLLVFASVLIVNTALKLKSKMGDKLGDKIFYGILLILDIMLAVGAIVVIVMAILGS